jgi:hypothetical protein
VRGFWAAPDETPPVVSAIYVPRPGRYIRGHHVAQPLQYLGSSASVAASRTCIQPCQSNAGTACSRNTENSKIGRLVLRQPPSQGLGRDDGLKEWLLVAIAASSLHSTTPFLMDFQIGSLAEIWSADGTADPAGPPVVSPESFEALTPSSLADTEPLSILHTVFATLYCTLKGLLARPRFPLPMSRQTVFC